MGGRDRRQQLRRPTVAYERPANGDIALLNLEGGHPVNCFSANTDSAGLTTSPANLESTYPSCTGQPGPANANGPLITELLCGAEGALVNLPVTCPAGHYPVRTHVIMHPLPKGLPTMPNPCAGGSEATRGAPGAF